MAYTFTRTGAQIEEIHNTVEDPKSNTQFSDDIRTIAGEYRGLWPDTGGSANKGDTYQTQVSGTPTGQYFTALQDTTDDPVGDDVNWRSVVSDQSLGGLTNYQADSVANMIAGIPVEIRVGEFCSTGGTLWERVSTSTGGIADFKALTSVSLSDFKAEDISDVWSDFISSIGRTEGHIDGDIDYLTSDYTPIDKSNVTLRFTGKAFIKLTQRTIQGGVLLAIPTSGADIIENVKVYNPQVDCNNIGYPTGDVSGEVGIGGAECKNVKFFGGVVRNCKHGTNSPTGTGGKGVQFEGGVEDSGAYDLTLENCTYAMSTQGIENLGSVPPYTNAKNAIGITYSNITAVNCDRLFVAGQTQSPPDPDTKINSCFVDGVIARNCGLEQDPSISATDFGPVIIDRYANAKVKNVVLINDSDYGTLGALVRMRSGLNNEIEISFQGDTAALISHQYDAGGQTGELKNNIFDITHIGSATYAIDGISGLDSIYTSGLYTITTDTIAQLLSPNVLANDAAAGRMLCEFKSLPERKKIEGSAKIVGSIFNTYPSSTLNFACDELRVNAINFTSGGAGQFIVSEGEDLIVGRSGGKTVKITSSTINATLPLTPASSGDWYVDASGFVKINS